MLKQGLSQKQQQTQTLSAEQIQQIKMLEIPSLELDERIREELENNPALEEAVDLPSEEQGEGEYEEENPYEDLSLDDYSSEDEIPAYKLQQVYERQEPRQEIPFASGASSLALQLAEQMKYHDLSPRQEEMLPYIIGNIEPDGYLHRSDEELLDDLSFKAAIEASHQELKQLVELVQSLDPAGIAARNLQDCLRLQLERMPESVLQTEALQLINNYFDDFANRRFERILQAMQIDEDRLRELTELIAKLNPKPANGWADGVDVASGSIRPDFVVEEQAGKLIVTQPEARELQTLRVSPVYKDMYRDFQAKKANRSLEHKQTLLFVKQKLEQANWFIEALAQRYRTLQNTMEAIVKLQESYFRTGELSELKPMILKDVAAITGNDISTISRVSNSKYVETDFGVFPLKYFFSEGITNTDGEDVSTREVKQTLAEIVAEEDKSAPLTDADLAKAMSERGYPIARRTVAKYRDELEIAPARLRREI